MSIVLRAVKQFPLSLQDIASVYQIFSDEVLGSGQFGIVYGGMLEMNAMLLTSVFIMTFKGLYVILLILQANTERVAEMLPSRLLTK